MDITLYNKIYDAQTERTAFLRTYIYNVQLEGSQAVTVSDKGLLSANKITCFVPIKYKSNKVFKEPGEFSRIALNDKEKYFTFKNGDLIVKGLVDFELSPYERGKKIEDLSKLYEVGTIISVIKNDFGNINLQHWEIGAK